MSDSRETADFEWIYFKVDWIPDRHIVRKLFHVKHLWNLLDHIDSQTLP